MIQVRNLTKIYTSQKGVLCKALDGVSFDLPDTGMVFVVGKSGCGKSTLLNLMGGLDKQTSGDVIVDGQAFSSFTERNFDNYRNNYVGFVFQDFYLLDALTVYQNVAVALELQSEEQDSRITEILQQVDMGDLADRYPKQLSGGQCQRAAIARALVKRPKMVLADEPTGNLDSKISRHVLQLLKKYSRDNLVLIVSHNAADAREFADRIIELADGQVVSDVERNPDAQDVCITDSAITVQKGLVFSQSQLQQINERLEQNKPVKLVQVDDIFVPARAVTATSGGRTIPDKRLSRRGKNALFGMFCRKQLTSLIVTVILVICLVAVLGVCQMFLQFDADEETLNLLQDTNVRQFAMYKGTQSVNGISNIDISKCIDVTDSDVQSFVNAGYDGKIYKLYNVPLITAQSDYCLEKYSRIGDLDNYRKFYCKTGNGVLVCDREYLASIYGDENGELRVLVGDIDSEGVASGVDIIVTDYFADSLCSRHTSINSYADVLGNKLSRYRVGAVIDTRYKERYSDLLQKVADGATQDELQDDTCYNDLLSELSLTLNTAYSFNPNFGNDINDYSKTTYKNFSYLQNPSLAVDGQTYSGESIYCKYNAALTGDQIMINRSKWRSVTGVNKNDGDADYWNSLIGKTVTLSAHDADGNELYSKDFNVVGTFVDGTTSGMQVSVQSLAELRKFDTIAYGLHFSDTSQLDVIYTAGNDQMFYVPSLQYTAVLTVAGAVEIFKEFFVMIVAVLYAASALLLVFFGVRSIRKNVFEIGVLRALGTKTHNLALMFALQMLVIGLIICLIAVPGMYVGVKVGNDILVKGFVSYTGNSLASHITIIHFRVVTAVIGALLVLALSIAASVGPLVVIRRIKPRQIISSKD